MGKRVVTQAIERRRAELGGFLKAHRARLSPEDFGMPPGSRRRTPGLRREVARHGEFAATVEQIAEVNEKICEARPVAGTDVPLVPEAGKGGSSARSRRRRPLR